MIQKVEQLEHQIKELTANSKKNVKIDRQD